MLVNRPPMGWNSWNTFSDKISDELIREMADTIVKLGLDKFGYNYVIIDDCWSEKQRDPISNKIIPDKTKFPHGMKPLSDYIHSLGLKFGMYSCCGVRTCADYPGSFDHEFLDAETFAEYGCDYLKYDNCFRTIDSNTRLQYLKMGNALRATGKDIMFAACEWGADDVWSWIRSTGAHTYRSTGDIFDNMNSYRFIAESQIDKLGASAPQCFNDLDMLTVGMYGKAQSGSVGSSGCTFSQYKQQFALWCMMGSPLILGCDLRSIDDKTLDLIKNPELLAINQDPEARPAFKAGTYAERDNDEIALCKQLSDGSIALAFFNFTDKERRMHLMFDNIGFPFYAGIDLHFYEIFSKQDCGIHRETFATPVKPFDCEVYRITTVKR